MCRRTEPAHVPEARTGIGVAEGNRDRTRDAADVTAFRIEEMFPAAAALS